MVFRHSSTFNGTQVTLLVARSRPRSCALLWQLPASCRILRFSVHFKHFLCTFSIPTGPYHVPHGPQHSIVLHSTLQHPAEPFSTARHPSAPRRTLQHRAAACSTQLHRAASAVGLLQRAGINRVVGLSGTDSLHGFVAPPSPPTSFSRADVSARASVPLPFCLIDSQSNGEVLAAQ